MFTVFRLQMELKNREKRSNVTVQGLAGLKKTDGVNW